MASSTKDLADRLAKKKAGKAPEYSAMEECMGDLASALAKKDSKAAAKAFQEAYALCSEE